MVFLDNSNLSGVTLGDPYGLALELPAPPPSGPFFTRGDANTDGGFNIADAIFILGVLFSGNPAGTCEDANDANDDGSLNIADAIFALGALFGGGGNLPAPFPGCGLDPTVDALGCAGFAACP